MTLGSGGALAALSAKQLSHGGQGSLPEYRHGTNQRIIAINSIQRAKTEMSAKHAAWLGSSTHGIASDKKGESLKRPNLFKAGMEGHLEGMSVKD